MSPTGSALSLEGKGLPGTAYYTGIACYSERNVGPVPLLPALRGTTAPPVRGLLLSTLLPTLLSYLLMVAILTGVRLISL